MNDIVSENGEEAPSFTYQHETGRKGGRRAGRGRGGEMEHNIDNLIMHFIISVTIECLPSLVARCTRAAVPARL